MKKVVLLFVFFIFYFSFLKAQSIWEWGKYGSGYGYVYSVAYDPTGNCFLTGEFEPNSNPGIDTLIFNADTLKNAVPNSYDAFIAKYSKDGNFLWARQTVCQNMINAIGGFITSTDQMGNAYLTATFNGNMKAGSYTLTTGIHYQGYLVKFDPNGNVLWTNQSSDTLGYVTSQYVCTDKKGESYITGLFGPVAVFGNDTIHCDPNGNAYLVKYSPNGNVLWAKAAASKTNASGGEGEADAVDNFGNVYVTGYVGGTEYFGTDTLNGLDQYDFFLAKYDSNGNVKWAKEAKLMSTFCYGWGYNVTCDPEGNVYAVGEFEDTLILDKDTLISSCDTMFNHGNNHTNFFLAKFDPNGNLKWAVQDNTPVSYGTCGWGLAADTMGHIYLSGGVGSLTNSSVTIDHDTTLTVHDTATHDAPTFLLKFDTAGNLLCANMFSYAGAFNNSIAVDPTGNYVYFGATLVTEAIFGKDTIDPWSGGLHYYPLLARWKECDATLCVPEVKEQDTPSVKVFPNPSTGIFTIALSHAELVSASQKNIEIYNVLGKKLLTETLHSVQGGNIINLSNQPNGVYLYRVLNEDGSLAGEGKLVIER